MARPRSLQPDKVLNHDKVQNTREIRRTTNYGQFLSIKGNRPVTRRHVNDLKKRIEKYGNMTDIFPVIVNERYEIIDGQHRLRALEELNAPVCYVVIPGANIETVSVLNTGGRSWNWHDRAARYAAHGNESYVRFLSILNKYDYMKYSTLLYFIMQRRKRTGFNDGELQFSAEEFQFVDKMAAQYGDYVELTQHNVSNYAIAAFRFMRNPNYKHDRMKSQLREYGEAVNRCYSASDYYNTLENIYQAR